MVEEDPALAKKTHGIRAGTLHPFTGPINKEDGTTLAQAGEKATDKDLASTSFCVEGAEGSMLESKAQAYGGPHTGSPLA